MARQLTIAAPEKLAEQERVDRHAEALGRWPRLWPELEEPNRFQAARLVEAVTTCGRGLVLLAVLIEDGR